MQLRLPYAPECWLPRNDRLGLDKQYARSFCQNDIARHGSCTQPDESILQVRLPVLAAIPIELTRPTTGGEDLNVDSRVFSECQFDTDP